MPNVASSLGSTQRYIPVVSQSQIGRYAGLFMHFPTISALNAAIAEEALNIGEASAIWTDNQPISVATEAVAGVHRVWKTGLGHARTVVLAPGKTAVLAANTNTVLSTSGAPAGGTGADGDIAIDPATGLFYTKAAGSWAQTDSTGVLSSADKNKLNGIAAGATANATDAQLRDRSTHTGTQLAATISDLSEAVDDRVGALLVAGTNVTLNYNDAGNTLTINAAGGGGATNLTTTAAPTQVTVNSDTGTDAVIAAADGTNAGLLLPAEKTKLAGIATGATANSSDATLLSRVNHTGTQTASTISDFAEAVDDRVGALLVAGTNVTLNYNDAANTLTINATGGAGATNLTTTAAPTQVTINSDTGTDAVIAAADGTNAGLFLPAEKTKLTGVATGATANSPDATLLNRANHTGTQTAATISDFSEAVDDRVGTLLVAGTNVTLNYNDAAGTLTINSTGGGSSSLTVETRSTFPYTVVAADNGKVLLLNSATAANVTVAPSLGAGFSCTFIQVGAGRITFVEGSGVAIENFNNLQVTSGPYAPVSLLPMGTDSYNLTGSVGLLTEMSTFIQGVYDLLKVQLLAGTNVTLTPNDGARTITIDATGGGGGSTNLTTTAAPTQVTINSDTGTDAVIAAADGTNAGLFLPAEKTKLTGVATGATANSSDATLLNRTNHTGTQTASTISDFSEAVDDRVGALAAAGSGITVTYNDAGNTLTLAADIAAINTSLLAVAPTVVVDATTARTLTAADNNKILRFTNAAAVTVTVPAAFSGFTCTIVQGGTGAVSLVASGTTLNGPSLSIDGQYRGLTLLPTGVANTFDIQGAVGNFVEDVQDVIGAMITAAGGSYNDAANTITLPGGGGANLTTTAAPTQVTINSDTGTDAVIAAADGTNAGLFLPAEKTKLTGIATGATANSPDATLLNRANHTGTQAISTITGLQTALDTLTINEQTASYTLVLADAGRQVDMNVAGANNLTIPLNSSVAFPVGTAISVCQTGAGATTIVLTGGVTGQKPASRTYVIAEQYESVTLHKVATDTWRVSGALTAV